MNTLGTVYTRFWRGTVVVISLALLAYLLYFHQLGTLLPGYSKAEIASYTASSDWHLIANNPIYAPYKVLVWLGTAVAHKGILVTRVVAACYGILAVLAFYLISRLRYQFWMAFAGTVMFATSAGFLHAARLGTGLVLQLAILAFVLCILWYRARPSLRVAIGYLAAILFALMWYVPGLIWLEAFGVLLLHGSVLRQLRAHRPRHIVAWALLFLAFISPLVWAIAHTPRLALSVVGFPQSLQLLSHVPHNLLDTILAIGIRSDASQQLWVDHLPLLNAIELTLAIIGVYTYVYLVRKNRSSSSILLIGATILMTLLASLGGDVTFICLVPLLYLFVISGLNNLVGQWLVVFPRNPIARATGVLIVTVMVFFSVLYQVRSYFVAWPHNQATRQVFHDHPKP
jgi:hypothetical protein